MANLTTTYMRQGRWKAAEELQRPVIRDLSKETGANNSDALMSITHLAFEEGNKAVMKKPSDSCMIVSRHSHVFFVSNHPHTQSSAKT